MRLKVVKKREASAREELWALYGRIYLVRELFMDDDYVWGVLSMLLEYLRHRLRRADGNEHKKGR